MKKQISWFIILFVFTSLVLPTNLLFAEGAKEVERREVTPKGIHLTWPENDVYHTMAVSWYTKSSASSTVYCDTVSQGDVPWKYGSKIEGSQHKIKTTRGTWNNWYHDVILKDLEPGTTYYFICGGTDGWSREYQFRTISLNQPVRFCFGGDSRYGAPRSAEIEGPTFQEARITISSDMAAEETDFVIFGGDMVLHGYEEKLWEMWFKDITDYLITEEGRMIPVVAVIGNHDLAYLAYYEGGIYGDMSYYDYYRGVFALPRNELVTPQIFVGWSVKNKQRRGCLKM